MTVRDTWVSQNVGIRAKILYTLIGLRLVHPNPGKRDDFFRCTIVCSNLENDETFKKIL